MTARRKSSKTCHAVKPDGARCRANAVLESGWCFFHHPALAEERRAAQSLGGSRIKTLAADAPDVKVADCRDVVALLGTTINQVRRGQVDPRIGNAVGYLAAILIRAVEQGELEGRIAELEAIIKTQSTALPDSAIMETDS
jgi:hypothetical protein